MRLDADSFDNETYIARPITVEELSVNSSYLIRLQQRWAWPTVTLSFAGAGVAAWLAVTEGVSIAEIGILVAMYVLTYLGLTVGYHRCFAHRAFKANPLVRYVLAILGSMNVQGPIVFWVATHRRHHQFSDVPGDPHSPHLHGSGFRGSVEGFFHAHIGWLFAADMTNTALYARDLLRDSVMRRINRLYLVWVMLGLLIPTLAGALLLGGVGGALRGLLWGGLVRGFIAYHATWALNSLTHVVGKRDFNTQDHSHNIGWLAMLTLGEGWHNNHHAFPYSAVLGLKWWQLDVSAIVIRMLKALGLAWDVKVPLKKAREVMATA
ncbi:acyl-CoA desaturase [Polaromonas sp. JS666]|uniref:acyl-CoA desaturase n=1 Tax=Polaromonas sp. (strain JS666 / ATCC BAA-500) TaxID=296591 RepID=UPI00004646A3|nr:acyl-CoA desaturase [Polaromonas sp. JS666]ABE47184.1 Delta-9 acyl-phospholipid desaturase [Polaromonas sp. JS666]